VKVSAEAARRFLVARHFLAPARSVPGGLDGVLAVMRKFGSIQFDPIAFVDANIGDPLARLRVLSGQDDRDAAA